MTVQPINAKAILRTLLLKIFAPRPHPSLYLSLKLLNLKKKQTMNQSSSQGLIKSNIKKKTFLSCQKSIKINYCLSVCPFLERGKCGVCYQIFNQTTQLSIKPGVSIRSEAHLISIISFKKNSYFSRFILSPILTENLLK